MAEEYLPRDDGSLSTRQTYRYTGTRAHEDAIERCRSYLSDAQWAAFMEAFDGEAKFKAFRFYFMMVGIEGYPVKAMLREFHPRYVRRFGAPSARQKLALVVDNAKGEQ
jgi:hypothetical protein